jgi:16S rRNA (uracil1498-N3)-methyltransferase
MQYLYSSDAKVPLITLSGDEHRYIFKVRRHRVGDVIAIRNLQDDYIYHYHITHIDKKSAILELQDSQKLTIKSSHFLHIGWCVIDTKNIEKVLPSLNEMGVSKISFIYCKRSQKSFKIDFKRLEKILLNSSQQCGRSVMMELDVVDSLQRFVEIYPDAKMLNFSQDNFVQKDNIDTIVVGCEGGFSDDEVALFDSQKIVGFNTPLILKSESAVCAISSKVLL